MLEKPKIKRVERQEKQVPNSIEQLIEYYGLENIWLCMEDIIDYINVLKNDSKEASNIITQLCTKVEKLEDINKYEKFVVENMGCGGNWNTKALQLYNSICTISKNNQNLGVGAPEGAYEYGSLISLNPRKTSSADYTISQIYIPDNPHTNGIYVRKKNSNWLKLSGTTVNAIK